jgi:catechol 2,3-dioxygenase-like lactoylglutathione lyase family enzyme
MPEDLVSVRYMVNDVDTAVDFYTRHFDFELRSNAAPAFADVVRGRLRLLLAGPTSSAGRPMPDGRTPVPAAGTESTRSSTTSPAKSSGCPRPDLPSATTSPPGRAGSRSSSTIPPETRSSSSSQRSDRRARSGSR